MTLEQMNITQSILQKLGDDDVGTIVRNEIKSILGSEDKQFEDRILNELSGYGPLTQLLDDPKVTEIMVNRFDELFYECDGKIQSHPETFLSPTTYQRVIDRILLEAGKTVDDRTPTADGTMLCGARIHVISRPATSGPVLTIRKHTSQDWSIDQLIESGMLSAEQSEILTRWILDHKNFILCGTTGCGKTTLLRALLKKIPSEDRIITLEDTTEINCRRPNALSLVTRMDPQGLVPDIGMDLLLKNCLRMRPDRIVVGEIRGPEALTLLDALSTGHSGSICSMHAQSAKHASQRLESLVSRAAPQWPMQNIRQMIQQTIHGFVILHRDGNKRKIKSIVEIRGLEDFGFLFEEI